MMTWRWRRFLVQCSRLPTYLDQLVGGEVGQVVEGLDALLAEHCTSMLRGENLDCGDVVGDAEGESLVVQLVVAAVAGRTGRDG